MKVSNTKTKSKLIAPALEKLPKNSKVSGIKKYKQQVDLDIDLDVIRDRKIKIDPIG